MATVIMDVEFPPTSTFEDKSTPAGKIWFRTLQIIALESDCRDLLYWGRWIDAPDKVSVIIDWLHFDQDNPFLKKYVQRRPHTKFLKDLCSILIDVPVFHRTRLYRTPLESYTTEVLTIYFPPSTLATKPVSDISRRFHLMFEAGSPMINNEGWHTLPIHRMDYDWVEDYVPHKGQLARAFVVCTDWRNAEAERSFKYESGQDFTNFFRAPGTSLEGLQWEDTTTYEGFLKHLSPLGYERHYIPFQRLRRDTFRDKKCCNCIIQ